MVNVKKIGAYDLFWGGGVLEKPHLGHFCLKSHMYYTQLIYIICKRCQKFDFRSEYL